MKKQNGIVLFGIVLIVMLLVGGSWVGSSIAKDTDVQYEVTLHVVYNAVSPGKAAAIIAEAQREHAGACKVEITSKKVEPDDTTLSNVTWSIIDATTSGGCRVDRNGNVTCR